MRRDDILALKEQRAALHKELVDKFASAEGEGREFTAEEATEYDRMEEEFRSLTSRWQRAEDLYKQEQEVDHSLNQSIDFRIEDGDDVPLTLGEYRNKMRGMPAWDSPEYRAAYWHYLTVGNLAELDIEE